MVNRFYTIATDLLIGVAMLGLVVNLALLGFSFWGWLFGLRPGLDGSALLYAILYLGLTGGACAVSDRVTEGSDG